MVPWRERWLRRRPSQHETAPVPRFLTVVYFILRGGGGEGARGSSTVAGLHCFTVVIIVFSNAVQQWTRGVIIAWGFDPSMT